MKKNMIVAAAVLASAVACTETEDHSADGIARMSFSVSTEQTKTVLDGANKTLWTGEEKLSVFDGESNNMFTAELSAPASTAQFTGEAKAADIYYALYPYSSAAKLEGTAVSTEIPASQTAVKGSFDPSAALLFGTADGSSITLHNVTAMLKLTVPANVTSIEVEGGGTAIAGSVSIDVESAEVSGAAASKVVLSGNGALEAGTYYIAVAPAMVSGLSVKLIDSVNGKYMLRSVNSSRALKANTIYDMGDFSTLEWVAESTEPSGNELVIFDNAFKSGFSVKDNTMAEETFDGQNCLKWEFASAAAWSNYGVIKMDPAVDFSNFDAAKTVLKFKFKVAADNGPADVHTLFRVYFGVPGTDVWVGAVGHNGASLEWYDIVVNDNEWHELSLSLKDYVAQMSGDKAAIQLGFTPKDVAAAVGTTIYFKDIRVVEQPVEDAWIIFDDAMRNGWTLGGAESNRSETAEEYCNGTKSIKWYCESAWFTSVCSFKLPNDETTDITSYSKLKFNVKITSTGNEKEHPFEPGDETFTIRIYGGSGADYSEAYWVYCARTAAEGGEGDWHTVEVPIRTSTDANDKWNCFVIQSGTNAYPFKHVNQFCFHNMEWSGHAGNIYIDDVRLVK